MDKSLEDIESTQIQNNEARQKIKEDTKQREQAKEVNQSTNLQTQSNEPSKEHTTMKIFEERTNQAIELKNNGNAFFKQKNYVEAVKQYSNALKLLDPNYFYGATEAELIKMAELSSNLLCNLGYCYFNSHDMVRAEIFFGEAITINPKYIKALHKRALSRYQLKKYQQAFQDIKLAFNLDKSNAEIHSAYSKILEKYNEQVKKNKEKMKEMSSKIFGNDTQRSNSPTKKSTKELEKSQQKADLKQEAKDRKGGWSWGQKITLAGAAIVIGAGILKALRR